MNFELRVLRPVIDKLSKLHKNESSINVEFVDLCFTSVLWMSSYVLAKEKNTSASGGVYPGSIPGWGDSNFLRIYE